LQVELAKRVRPNLVGQRRELNDESALLCRTCDAFGGIAYLLVSLPTSVSFFLVFGGDLGIYLL
jgi:hypothetical protein